MSQSHPLDEGKPEKTGNCPTNLRKRCKATGPDGTYNECNTLYTNIACVNSNTIKGDNESATQK